MLELGRHVYLSGWQSTDIGAGLQPGTPPQPVAVDQFGALFTHLVVTPAGGGAAALAMVPLDVNSGAVGLEGLPAASFNFLWTGADANTFVRQASYTADNMDPATPPFGVAVVNEGPEWSVPHTPAVGVRATVTRAAVPNARHVCKAISATLAVALADVGVAGVLVTLRDGATGAGTILWSKRLCIVSAGGMADVNIAGLNIVGSENTAMTLEFAAAPGAASFEDVTLTGRTADAGA